MGYQEMDNEAAESGSPALASYRIIRFKGNQLPDEYKPVIFSKYLMSLRFGNRFYKLIEKNSYFKVHHLYLTSILNRPDSEVRLAVLSDDHDVVLGFSIAEPLKLHYVYVFKDYRKNKIGTELTMFPFDTITHLTDTGLSIWKNKFDNKRGRANNMKPVVVFNPFA